LPETEATVPGARPAPLARPQARPQAARPQAAAPRTPPTTDVVPVQVPRASVASNSRMKLLMGVGLAAVLLGVGAGVVVSKRDSGPAVPDVTGTAASKDPVAGTGSTPPPLPTRLDPPPRVETPVQPETPPPTPQTVVTASDPVPEKTEQNSAQQKATSDEPERSPEGPGLLRLQAKCWGTVYIDGKPRGRAPMKPISLPAGTHKLEIRDNPTLGYESDVVIRSAKTTTHVAYCRPRTAG